MKKDKTIIYFMQRLKTEIDSSLVEFVDYWDGDLCALGIKRGDKVVYISTYNFVDEKIVKYDYDLEIMGASRKDEIKVVSQGRGVNEKKIIFEVKVFLEV